MIVRRVDRLRVAPGLDDARILADQFSTRVVNEDRLLRTRDLLHAFPVAVVKILTGSPAGVRDADLLVLGVIV